MVNSELFHCEWSFHSDEKTSGVFTHTGTDYIPGRLLQMAQYSGSRFSLWESLSFLGIPGATVPLDLHFRKNTGEEEKITSPQTCSLPWTINSLLLACSDWHLQSIPQWSYLNKTSIAVNVKPESMLLGYYKSIAPVIPVCGGAKLPLWFWIWRTTAGPFPSEASFLQVAVNIFYSFNHLQNTR